MTRSATICAVGCLVPAGAVLMSLISPLDAADAVVLSAPTAHDHQKHARYVSSHEPAFADHARQALQRAIQSRGADNEEDLQGARAGLAVAIFEELIYGLEDADARTGIRGRFESQLQRQIDAIDVICSLTEFQKKKLRLAGGGDIERIMDRIRRETRTFQSVQDDEITQKMIQKMAREAVELQSQLIFGCFD